MNLSLCYIIIFIRGIISLCWNYKHIIISLLRLEFIILRSFCYFSFLLSFKIRDIFILLVFLTFGVCEGVLGLSCLVTLIRSHGNDNLLSINIIIC